MTQFAGRLAVLTGAASGIGRETALQLAAAGCNLALADMNGDSLQTVAADCRKAGVRVSAEVLDVTDRAKVGTWPISVGQALQHRRAERRWKLRHGPGR